MQRKIKYGKILIAIFLTVLIWVWADLAKIEEWTVPNATITIAKATDPRILATFKDDLSSVLIEQIVLKGSASSIADARRQSQAGMLDMDFFLDVAVEDMTEPADHVLDIPGFLKKTNIIKELGLTVESCQPNKLYVNIVELEKKTLKIECRDARHNQLKTKSIEPDTVEMFVPVTWLGERLTATVLLTENEIEQAKHTPVEKRAFIELPGRQIRKAGPDVKITISEQQEDRLGDETIIPTLGIALSPPMQGKYRVEVINLNEVISAVSIKSTPAAKQAYSSQKFHMTLYILDNDKNTTDEQSRAVVYNFPEVFLRENEIELNQQPVIARFKLTPIAPVP